MDKYFKKADDLSEIKDEKKESYFHIAGDLDADKNETKKVDINDYLLTVVSGKKYDAVCELGVLMGVGRTIVNLEQLMKMVDEGYNIVSANVINVDRNMIEVEFQRYIYDEELMEKRRRF